MSRLRMQPWRQVNRKVDQRILVAAYGWRHCIGRTQLTERSEALRHRRLPMRLHQQVSVDVDAKMLRAYEDAADYQCFDW